MRYYISTLPLNHKRKVGGPTRKIILLMLGDCANDDGSGIWPSKATVAAKTEVHKDTVKKHIREMVKAGLLIEVGKKPCSNGFTTVYNMDLDILSAYELTTGVNKHPVELFTPEEVAERQRELGLDITPNHPKPSENLPKTGDIFEKLWKEVLSITPSEIKGRHVKKKSRGYFDKIVNRKKDPISASRIANAVLWFYDQPMQKKKDDEGLDRGYMAGLERVIRDERFSVYLDKGTFHKRTSESDEEEAWKFRADYANKNNGEWPPSGPSSRSMPSQYRDLVDKRYWGRLGWESSQGGLNREE